MKINKAIFGVDESYFMEFWPIQAKICKELLEIEPVLFLICDEDSDFYNDGHGLVKKIKKVKNNQNGNVVHSGLLACIVRMYGTKYFPDEVCITCDLDMLMINKDYFVNQVEKYENDSLVIYSSDAYDLNRPEAVELFKNQPFPFTQEMYNYPYNAAKGKVFNQILNTDCTFEEFVNRHDNYKPGYTFMWMIDEFYFADCVNNKNHGVEVHKLKRGYTSPWIADRRIDRGNFPVQLEWEGEIEFQNKYGVYDEQKLRDGYYIDVNCCRPYSKYKNEIDKLVEIIRNKYMKKEEKIKELLLMPRMFYDDYDKRYNQLKGLKMLIDEYMTENFVMVEIGSFAGISSELFALHCKELYCVDLWDPYWEITDKQRIEFAEFSFDKMIKNYENVYKVKKSSVEASKNFEDGSLDLVYIDAAHDYDSVRQDILTWLPKIKKGGFIAGHDYRYDSNIGVYEAVNDIFVNDYKINSFPDSSFIIKI
jgi:predicted O-methyltransferase YrrM